METEATIQQAITEQIIAPEERNLKEQNCESHTQNSE